MADKGTEKTPGDTANTQKPLDPNKSPPKSKWFSRRGGLVTVNVASLLAPASILHCFRGLTQA